MCRSLRPYQFVVFTLALGLVVGGCGGSETLDNRRPTITSLVAYPDSIGPADSVIVVCTATDPDGDVLVYDWHTDARLIIKGNPPNQYYFYNAHTDSEVFYPGPLSISSPIDTAWVQCFSRDRKGMSDSRLIQVLVHR